MEIILSSQVESFTGTLRHDYGYYIRRYSDRLGHTRFFSHRRAGEVAFDGHMNFIWYCAQLARGRVYFCDTRVTAEELISALEEAKRMEGARLVRSNYPLEQVLNAKQVIDIFNSIDMREIMIFNTKL